MKILVLNGSPKGENSNTMQLTRAFLAGAGWADAETIDVPHANIKGCLGCFACWNKTPGRCVLQDEMNLILERLISADVIVWSFPLYYYSVPGGLKNLIDRQLPLNLPFMATEEETGGHPPRYDLSHQRHILISTCGFWTPEGNYNAVLSMFDHMLGKNSYEHIFCGQGELFRVPELKSTTEAYLEKVHRAGAEYATERIQAETLHALAEPLFPKALFERMANASWGIEENGAPQASTDDSLTFTKQMAALYQPDGLERVLEFHYTDIGKTYQLLLSENGANVISDDLKPYTTRIETPYALWRSISRGEISGQDALFQRLYTVAGDFNLMMQWDTLFGIAPKVKDVATTATSSKTSMLLLLLPWIVLWAAPAIHPFLGSLLSIGVAVCIPLFWLNYRPVIYEQISIPLVVCLSLGILLGLDIRLLISLSYLVFGLLWIGGTFPSIPLTAHYSSRNYGGEGAAFANPLFIQTNRILTAAWGGLYLLMPFWTYFLMGTDFSHYIGLINSVFPAFMGIFTAWFQKWYPAKYAKG